MCLLIVRVQRSSPRQHASIHPGLVSFLFIPSLYSIERFFSLAGRPYVLPCAHTVHAQEERERGKNTYGVNGLRLRRNVGGTNQIAVKIISTAITSRACAVQVCIILFMSFSDHADRASYRPSDVLGYQGTWLPTAHYDPNRN